MEGEISMITNQTISITAREAELLHLIFQEKNLKVTDNVYIEGMRFGIEQQKDNNNSWIISWKEAKYEKNIHMG